MNLFNTETKNLLPFDGSVFMSHNILSQSKANRYFQHLLENIDWENDRLTIYGKEIITKRKVAWFGDEAYPYTYSKTTKTAIPWTKELTELKQTIEEKTGEVFNSCLLNLYHNGQEGMSWHNDDEIELKKHGVIASLSLGAARKFSFKHKESKKTTSLILENGSLLIMKDQTQDFWLHSLPKTKKVNTPRINLTFRQYDVSIED